MTDDLQLYPYQETGVGFLAARKRAMLCDRMGLGKSVQAIRASDEVGADMIQVVCPASAVPNWRNEWKKWGGHGAMKAISYASLIRRDWKGLTPDVVVLDESHYCKTPSAKRTRAALGLARNTYQDGGYAWLLSGTPMPNNPVELWPPMKYLWPEIAESHGCRTKREWRKRFTKCRRTPYGPKPYAVRNGTELRESINRIMLRRTLDDVGLELPPLRVELSRLPKGQADTDALEEYEAWEETDYTSTLRRLLGDVKAPLVAKQVIEELEDGAYEQTVVLYYHTAAGTRLRKEFTGAGFTTVGFDGSTSQGDRQKAIDTFESGGARIFCAQMTAAGIAINLTAATEMVLLEPSWSPSENNQAIDRIHRIGQDNPCRARIFALSGTLDEAIMNTIKTKMKMRKEILE